MPSKSNKPLNIRYTPTRQRITCRIKQHFTDFNKRMETIGSTGVNKNRLAEKMGVPMPRLNKIIAGNEPTLGEAAQYAQYFGLQITEIFTLKN